MEYSENARSCGCISNEPWISWERKLCNHRTTGRTNRSRRTGLKIHEDWGSTPAVIDASLKVADEYDVQVAIHTDTLNEVGFLEDTIKAIDGRVIHTYHTEGAGGGHAPDIIKAAMYPNFCLLLPIQQDLILSIPLMNISIC